MLKVITLKKLFYAISDAMKFALVQLHL